MIRNVLMRCRNSKLTTIVCVTSLCINIFLLISSRHERNDLVKYTVDAGDSVEVTEHKYDSSNSNISSDKIQGHLDRPSNAISSEQVPQRNPENESEDSYEVCTLCPFDPPNLLGNLTGMMREMNVETLALVFPDMKAARLKPKDCVARQRIAIIIPYRNRYPHLHILLHNLIPFLTRQQADVTFFVIDQAMPETFNRGALLNVGFLEAEKIHQFDCYIFHDVDLLPLNDRHLYRCGDDPKHFAVAMNKYRFKIPYKDYFGGAVGFSRRQFLDINGCSNVYFGWGGEDDELKERVLNKGYTINRSPVTIARYDMIKHTRDKGNEANPVRKRILSSTKARQQVDGLNTITYKVNSVRLENFYIWINVSLNRTEILQNTPSHILEAILTEQDPIKVTLKPRGKVEEAMQRKNETARRKNTPLRRKDESVQADSNIQNNAPAKESADNTHKVAKS